MGLLKSRRIIAFKLCFYFHKRVLKGCSLFVRDDWMFWKPVFSKSWLRIRFQCSISICFKFLTDRWYVVTKDNLVEEGGTGGSESPASRTMFSHLPYFYAPLSPDSHPSLCCSLLQVKRIKNPGLIFKLCQNITFLFIFWPLVDIEWKFQNFNRWVFLTK